MPLTRMLPLRSRRRLNMINAVCKLYQKTHEEDATARAHHNWKVISTFSTITPLFRSSPLPTIPDELPQWRETQTAKVQTEKYRDINNGRRVVPSCQELPPMFRSNIGWRLERVAAIWYLNRLPRSRELSDACPVLSHLMSKTRLHEEEILKIEEQLNKIIDLNKGTDGQ